MSQSMGAAHCSPEEAQRIPGSVHNFRLAEPRIPLRFIRATLAAPVSLISPRQQVKKLLVRVLCSIAWLCLPVPLLAGDNVPSDWQALYRNRTLITPYKHYSVIADGVAGKSSREFESTPVPAFLGMMIWASSPEEAAHMVHLFTKRVGFRVKGEVEVYVTELDEPPQQNPHAYRIKLTRYDPNKK